MSPAQIEDPLAALVAKKLNLVTIIRGARYRLTDAKADDILNREDRVNRAILKRKPQTLAGALAVLKAAKHEFDLNFREDADIGHRIIICAIRGAIDVLEKEVGAS